MLVTRTPSGWICALPGASRVTSGQPDDPDCAAGRRPGFRPSGGSWFMPGRQMPMIALREQRSRERRTGRRLASGAQLP